MKAISLDNLAEKVAKGLKVVDVRTPVEFRSVHLVDSENIPLDSIKEAALPKEEFYVICKSGMRAKKAAEILNARGCQNFTLVTGGGVDQCYTKAFKLERGETGLSLERQVRIVAGLIVLSGSLMTLLVHPHFIAVPLFVGAGLTFAGITNFCGMALLLAKMPWNS